MTPAELTSTTQVASIVPQELADEMLTLARRSERSMAAEIRLALRAWVDAARVENGERSA